MPTSADLRIAGVAAFQRLWNRHHPHHRLREDGEYDVLTNMAFDRAPAAGFHYATEQVAAETEGEGHRAFDTRTKTQEMRS